MMDLFNIPSHKEDAAAAVEAQLQQQISYSMPMSHTSSNSDVSSDQSFTTRQLHPSERYPFPAPVSTIPMRPVQALLASLQESFNIPDEMPSRPAELEKKIFACSCCSKGCTDRSNLAQHGQLSISVRILLTCQNAFTVARDNIGARGSTVAKISAGGLPWRITCACTPVLSLISVKHVATYDLFSRYIDPNICRPSVNPATWPGIAISTPA